VVTGLVREGGWIDEKWKGEERGKKRYIKKWKNEIG